jgi:hypothetical protein
VLTSGGSGSSTLVARRAHDVVVHGDGVDGAPGIPSSIPILSSSLAACGDIECGTLGIL